MKQLLRFNVAGLVWPSSLTPSRAKANTDADLLTHACHIYTRLSPQSETRYTCKHMCAFLCASTWSGLIFLWVRVRLTSENISAYMSTSACPSIALISGSSESGTHSFIRLHTLCCLCTGSIKPPASFCAHTGVIYNKDRKRKESESN